jgi:hypothetical protein
MAYLIGVVVALALCATATIVGFDRDRAFYPILTIVIASYYALFAVMGGSTPALIHESLVVAVFFLIAIAGFKRSLWLVVFALAAHGLFDFFHGDMIPDPGVPAWWPPFCLAFDIVAAAYLSGLLLSSRIPALASSSEF